MVNFNTKRTNLQVFNKVQCGKIIKKVRIRPFQFAQLRKLYAI